MANILTSSDKVPYDALDSIAFYQQDGDPSLSTSLFHSIAGFKVPALPVITAPGRQEVSYLSQLCHRFAVLLRSLHESGTKRVIALQVMSHPERALLGSEVAVYLLCRVAGNSYGKVVSDVDRLAEQFLSSFPTEGAFQYATPVRLDLAQLKEVTFQDVYDPQKLRILELRKYEDSIKVPSGNDRFIGAVSKLDYIPHPFWVETRLEPWLILIEALANFQGRAAITVTLEPVDLVEIEAVAKLAEQYRLIDEAGTRRRDLIDQAAQASVQEASKRSWVQKLSITRAYQAQGLNDYLVRRAKQGAVTYEELLSWKDQLFLSRITIAVHKSSEEPLAQLMRTVLSSPQEAEKNGQLGWVRPVTTFPKSDEEKLAALNNLQWLGQRRWGASSSHPKLWRLRSLVTTKEIVGIFHVPAFSSSGQTSALSSVDVPFVIPPEVISVSRYEKPEKWVEFGYLYQRERWLSPQQAGDENALAFKLPLSDLEKPSLLVGAPGSGKSNFALYLLSQLWNKFEMPFLVLDPSTGLEYRYLFADPGLAEDLILYTAGDEECLPFRFNPFEVPPNVTVRAHITRLLACFKAAYEMWDPLPAIYEAALVRVYTQPPYAWSLDQKGDGTRSSPCLADFAHAVVTELEEKVLPDYGEGTEAAGILLGASKIRVNGILANLGHIVNVRQDDANFFQRLLRRPVVIELGAIGDPNSIALVMAFLVTQLVGHIEHAFRQGVRDELPHLLLIEEAHRLLSSEQPVIASPNQGNVRGKSAEELNNLLAEVRKYRQGIMVLDQRPSSLVGGVLDNALINIMCRLNDRVGFEHLSNVLNLNPAQQRFVRTRLLPGQSIMLDASSGQPVLVKAPLIVDKLRRARLEAEKERQKLYSNALRSNLLPPDAETAGTPSSRVTSQKRPSMDENWTLLSEQLEAELVSAVRIALERNDVNAARRAIRSWIGRNRSLVNSVLERVVFAQVIEHVDVPDKEEIEIAFEQSA